MKKVLTILCLAGLFVATSCGQAEKKDSKTEEEATELMDNMNEGADEATDAVEEAADETMDATENAVDTVKKEVENATDGE